MYPQGKKLWNLLTICANLASKLQHIMQSPVSCLKLSDTSFEMPKSHLRQVHQQFHSNALEVVVATIAFGMGIDRSIVSRIIHYGFPQGQATEDMNCSSVPRYRSGRRRCGEVPSFRTVISYIREKFPRFATTDKIWWQALAHILEGMGYIQEAAEIPRVLIQYPELTEVRLNFLSSQSEEEGLYAYPDVAMQPMLLATNNPRPFSSFSEWGRGWADPERRWQENGEEKKKEAFSEALDGFHHCKGEINCNTLEAQKVI